MTCVDESPGVVQHIALRRCQRLGVIATVPSGLNWAADSAKLEPVADTELDCSGQRFVQIIHGAGVLEPHDGALVHAR